MSSANSPTMNDRQATFHCTLAPNLLVLNEMIVRESVSGLFECQLVLSSQNAAIDLSKLIGQTARVEMKVGATARPRAANANRNAASSKGHKIPTHRQFCGFITEASFAGYRDQMADYRIVLRPWLWFLSQTSNNRIFQDQSVPAIIKAVCKAHRFDDIVDRLREEDYPKRTYCVQYRETDFDFISRLMEEEGIYYFFEHEDNKHKLVLSDSRSARKRTAWYEKVPYYPPTENVADRPEHITDVKRSFSVRTGTFRLRDFDFTKPNVTLDECSISPKSHSMNNQYERYEYPGRFDASDRGKALAAVRLQDAQADHETLHVQGNVRGLMPGFLFTLFLTPQKAQDGVYMALELTHRLVIGGYDSGGTYDGDAFEYGCVVTAIPESVKYSPPRVTPKPFVQGPQTAIVVGKQNEEIWTDVYGRIKVKFHWDLRRERRVRPSSRHGEGNENSSCWIRVAQALAGSRWGSQFIPRIGQEVIVEFLEGDPDQPIVTGAVYNASNLPPYPLPQHASVSGIKTRSTKGGTSGLYPKTGENYSFPEAFPNAAASGNYNEIRFEDKKSYEELYVRAEKDMKVDVKNNRNEKVGQDETVSIERNRTHTVKGIDTLNVNKEQNITIDKKRTLTCKEAELRDIKAKSTQTIGGKWETTATGGVKIKSPVDIRIDSDTKITLAAPTIVRTDESWISKTSHSLSLDGFAMGVAGSTVDLKLNAISLLLTDVAIKGINIGVTGLDIGATGAEIKNTPMETKNTILEFKNAAISLKSAATAIQNGAISIKNAAINLMS